MYFYAIEISVYFVYIIRSASYIASKQVMQHWYIISNYLYSNMLSHWYLHLIAFFLHYSWVASYRNFLLNYLYFSSVYFFTIEQNIFFYIKTQCYFLLTCTCNSLPKDICATHFHKLYDIHKYHRVFMMCMQQFSKLRRFLFWNAPSKLSDFNTHRANNKI